MLCGIHDLEMQHLKEHRNHDYEKGRDDAMGQIDLLVKSIIAAPCGQSPLEQRLDNALAPHEDTLQTDNTPVNHPSHYTAGQWKA